MRPNSAAHFHLMSRPHSHIARFHYPCTLNNLTFLAFVTIELREMTAGHIMATPRVSLETREGDAHGTSQNINRQRVESVGNATQDERL